MGIETVASFAFADFFIVVPPILGKVLYYPMALFWYLAPPIQYF
jgi:hypothetical protein